MIIKATLNILHDGKSYDEGDVIPDMDEKDIGALRGIGAITVKADTHPHKGAITVKADTTKEHPRKTKAKDSAK